MNNRNVSVTVGNKGKELFQKHYDSTERFRSELEYIPVFKRKGFNVPEIVEVDQKNLTITFAKIYGSIYDKLPSQRLQSCIKVLAHISNAFLQKGETALEREIYLEKVKRNLAVFLGEIGNSKSRPKLEEALGSVKKVCLISIFKDAKPSNWIFVGKQIYLVDFDYVRPSFYLADLAQLLSYSLPADGPESLLRKLLDSFLQAMRLSLTADEIEQTLVLLQLAIVNSNMASVEHNPRLSLRASQTFGRQNFQILQQLNII